MEQRFDAFQRMEQVTAQLPDRARARIIGAGYDELLSSVRAVKPLDRASDHELELLYRAARLASFYTGDEKHVRDMASFLDELARRDLATPSHYAHLYEAFIKTRMLTEARELARRHPLPELEPLPALREAPDLVAGQPTEWAIDPSRRELLRRSVDVHRPAQIVVVSHPLCHFSQAAMRDIQADAALGEIFREHARWLAPQDTHLKFDIVQRWNREHPGQETTLAFRREEWPMLDSWGTPTFYFLQDGAVTAKVEGWPKAGRRPELLAALRQIGLAR